MGDTLTHRRSARIAAYDVVQVILGLILVAAVLMPPYAPPASGRLSQMSPSVLGHLDDRRDWFVETPLEAIVDGGIVKTCLAGEVSWSGEGI